MGSGSSKAENSQKKPVANVNKTSNVNNNLSKSQVERTPVDSSHSKENIKVAATLVKDPDFVQSEQRPFEDAGKSKGNVSSGAGSHEEDELNELLRMPDNTVTQNRIPSPQKQTLIQTVDYPETYAQRKQREQYTLNQQLLIRQKTIFRNPNDWRMEDEQEVIVGGFDASKFRQANQSAPHTQKSVFSASKSGLETSYTYDQRELEEMDVTPRHNNQSREMPVYNASEQDLMASLERDLV